MSTKTAPFGTQDTPLTRVRIIGGKSVRIPEEADFGSPYGSPRTGQFGVAKGPQHIIPEQQRPEQHGLLQPSQHPQQIERYNPNFNQTQSQQAYNPLYLQQQQLFKQLERQELNQLYGKNKQHQEPWQQRQQQEQQWHQKQHLQMHQFPQATQPKNVAQNSNFPRSHEWNNHPVIPPIGSSSSSMKGLDNKVGDNPQRKQKRQYQYSGPNFPTENPLDPLLNQLPRDSYLPRQPVRFSKEEELYLRRCTMQGLKDFNNDKLKELYMDLTGYDKHLTGFVEYHDLSLLLSKYKIYITTQELRLIASMFVDSKYPGMANYEKVLSFIDSALKERNLIGPITNRSDGNLSHRSVTDVSPVTHAPIGNINAGPPPFSNNIGDTKLFRIMQDGEVSVNFESVWQKFRQADRQQRNTLSKEQILALSADCRITVPKYILDQIIERCDSSHGQYNWRQYLEFLEKIYPTKTGLDIPESKKPSEFVKHYPEPSSDWPKVPLKYPDTDADRPAPSLREPSPVKQVEVMTGRIDKIQDGRAGILPEEQGRPAGIPTGMAQIQTNESREKQIKNLENQLNQLEIEHERARTKALEERKVQKRREHSVPWIDRFLKLGDALHGNDQNNSGYVSYYETKWLAHEYNRSWKLDIGEGDIDAAIKWSLEGEKVNIDAFLKRLVLLEPK